MRTKCSMCGKYYNESLYNVIRAACHNFLWTYLHIRNMPKLSPMCETCWTVMLKGLSFE